MHEGCTYTNDVTLSFASLMQAKNKKTSLSTVADPGEGSGRKTKSQQGKENSPTPHPPLAQGLVLLLVLRRSSFMVF